MNSNPSSPAPGSASGAGRAGASDPSGEPAPFITSEQAGAAADDATGGARSSSTGTAATSGQQAADLVQRAAQGAHATIDRLASQAAPAAQHLQKSLEETGDMLHQRADQAREMGREWTESLRCSVREHPLAAVATALAVGLLVARLSR